MTCSAFIGVTISMRSAYRWCLIGLVFNLMVGFSPTQINAAPAVNPPESLLNWQIPAIQADSLVTFENKERKAKRVYHVRSWFFGPEEIHMLENEKKDGGLRLVLHAIAGDGRLTAWSKGTDDALGGTLWNNRKAAALIGEFSPWKDLQRKLGALDGSGKYTVESVMTSPSGDTGTATLRMAGVAAGESYRDDTLLVASFDGGKLISAQSLVEGNDLKTGAKSGPYLQSEGRYQSYEAPYPSLPRRVWRNAYFPPDVHQFETMWEVQKIEPLGPTTTARSVLAEVTAGLAPDRWPAPPTHVNRGHPSWFGKLGWGVIWRFAVVLASLATVTVWLRRSRRVSH